MEYRSIEVLTKGNVTTIFHHKLSSKQMHFSFKDAQWKIPLWEPLETHVSGICELCEEEVEDLPHILLPKCLLLKDKAVILHRFAKETFFVSEKAA